LRQNYFAKKLQSQTVSGEKLQKTLMYKKAACKKLVKFTPGIDVALLQKRRVKKPGFNQKNYKTI